MNRLLYFLLVVLATVAALYFNWPWYSIGLLALLLAVPFRMRRRGGFWFAYLAGLFVYGGYLTYLELQNDGILANRMGVLFQVGSGWTVAAIAAFFGALTTGLGGWTGVNLRKALWK
jgi:hypothetical protein